MTSNVDILVGLYRSNKNSIESWFKQVRNELQGWTEDCPEKRIHSISGRLKDDDHFRDKIVRKGSAWTQSDVFDEVEDLAAMRILTLYRNDLAILDYFIYQSSVWRVLKAEANYDKARYHDNVWFKDLGFTDCNNLRKLKQNDRGYSSIHYILVPKIIQKERWARNCPLKCELQIRTIHEEAWGEFSHEFTYPYDATDPLAGALIKRLSGLLHLAEDMVADIRRAPADGKLFQRAHSLARPPTPSAQPAFDSVHELIAESYFMNRSAPLAAMALMTKYTGKSTKVEKGTSIGATRIVSLGFGKLDDSGDGDELARLYLDAHKIWKDDNGQREVAKFFVWPLADGKKFPVPELFVEFSENIELWLVPQLVHEEIVSQIEEALGPRKETFPSLARFQFFLWGDGNGTPPTTAASLPRRQGLTEEKVIGFFAPYRDADLVAGVLWLKDSNDPVRLILNTYADILLALRSQNGLLVRITRHSTSPPLTALTDEQQSKLKVTVDSELPALLHSLGI